MKVTQEKLFQIRRDLKTMSKKDVVAKHNTSMPTILYAQKSNFDLKKYRELTRRISKKYRDNDKSDSEYITFRLKKETIKKFKETSKRLKISQTELAEKALSKI